MRKILIVSLAFLSVAGCSPPPGRTPPVPQTGDAFNAEGVPPVREERQPDVPTGRGLEEPDPAKRGNQPTQPSLEMPNTAKDR
jgi:hypothetical protein